jgi:hypothetical protein
MASGAVAAVVAAAVAAAPWIGPLVLGMCAVAGAASLGLYLVPLFIAAWLLPTQDLKRKYSADWGASVSVPAHACAPVWL